MNSLSKSLFNFFKYIFFSWFRYCGNVRFSQHFGSYMKFIEFTKDFWCNIKYDVGSNLEIEFKDLILIFTIIFSKNVWQKSNGKGMNCICCYVSLNAVYFLHLWRFYLETNISFVKKISLFKFDLTCVFWCGKFFDFFSVFFIISWMF